MSLRNIDERLLRTAGGFAARVRRRNGLDQWRVAREILFASIVLIETSMAFTIAKSDGAWALITAVMAGLFLLLYRNSRRTVIAGADTATALIWRREEYSARLFGVAFPVVLLITTMDVRDLSFALGTALMSCHLYLKVCDPDAHREV